jgi:hypothetical protein
VFQVHAKTTPPPLATEQQTNNTNHPATPSPPFYHNQDLSPAEYEAEKERVADAICARLDAVFPGLSAAVEFREVRGFGFGFDFEVGRVPFALTFTTRPNNENPPANKPNQTKPNQNSNQNKGRDAAHAPPLPVARRRHLRPDPFPPPFRHAQHAVQHDGH